VNIQCGKRFVNYAIEFSVAFDIVLSCVQVRTDAMASHVNLVKQVGPASDASSKSPLERAKQIVAGLRWGLGDVP